MGEIFPFMLPLWAIFNGIFLKEMRDMEFQLEFLYFNGSSFLKWLHHPSNENKPRRLKLFTGNNEYKIILDISSLIQKLKEVHFLIFNWVGGTSLSVICKRKFWLSKSIPRH